MGVLDIFRRPSHSTYPGGGDVSYAWFTPRVEYLSGPGLEGAAELMGAEYRTVASMSPAELWRTQPHLRTVVSFLARNLGQLGLHTFTRVGDERQRDRTSTAARALRYPNSYTTAYDLIFSLVVDLCLYDVAYWLPLLDGDRVELHRLPPAWVRAVERNPFEIGKYVVTRGKDKVEIDASQVIRFGGYSPGDPRKGSPTLDALRDVLQEQVNSSRFRAATWKRGGKVSAVLKRPAGAPQWSDDARKQFREDWNAHYTGEGSGVGGTPILGDGMDLQKVDLAAKDQQWAEGVRLGLNIVAAAYHVNPTMVGSLENSNYSNVREFRKMLYGETLGPLMAQIEDVVNTFALPLLGADRDSTYVEFNIKEKLQGNFEEQSAAMSSAVGGPWMTRNEARSRENLPAVDGGDELIVPLNVLVGGQASPRDSGSQNRNAAPVPALKAADPDRLDDEVKRVERVLVRHVTRQRDGVLRALGLKAADVAWWSERYDEELAEDLARAAQGVTDRAAIGALAALGEPADLYDGARSTAYLRKATTRQAEALSAAMRQRVAELVDGDTEDMLDALGDAFAGEERASYGRALAMARDYAGFGRVEGGRRGGATGKRWSAGRNPRDSHQALDGVTVALDEDFLPGLPWPGGSSDPSESANCNCDMTIVRED